MKNDLFINIQEMENQLESMEQTAESLNSHFPLLSQKVAYIFSKIKKCHTLQEADPYFDALETIKTGLARLLYKYEIGMPERLVRFVGDFDNLEPIYKKYYFEKIISGEYSY
jgi:hypothetical protein